MENDDVVLLCDHEVFQGDKKNPTLWALWFPLGILVAISRVFLLIIYTVLIQFCSVHTKKKTYRNLLRLLGIRITCNLDYDTVQKHTNGCIVAANHISVFDHFPALAMPLSTLMVHHVDSLAGKVMGFLLFKGSGSSYWEVNNLKQMMKQFRDWKKSPDGVALYVTPEATINNRRGLFRFRPDFVVRGRPVVPLAVSINLPFGLAPNPIDSSGVIKFLRLLSSPTIHFHLEYLDKLPAYVSESESGTAQHYADQIQQKIANNLAIPATQVTREDKHQYRAGRKK
ncbi:hypothetical protein [Serratia sp. M24T3]|uniref:hypothetical protein n=1 Tax=Serratia sp. M24T3 TaxID=932213 RepID=UPI00025B9B9A|nr:hypothetical protein [Serratia sp. M24T3]EIC85991.1 hypothetical protein SPM24T3_04247 [Serratia sp. M24T3]